MTYEPEKLAFNSAISVDKDHTRNFIAQPHSLIMAPVRLWLGIFFYTACVVCPLLLASCRPLRPTIGHGIQILLGKCLPWYSRVNRMGLVMLDSESTAHSSIVVVMSLIPANSHTT
jgi:hypothetical protein